MPAAPAMNWFTRLDNSIRREYTSDGVYGINLAVESFNVVSDTLSSRVSHQAGCQLRKNLTKR